MDEKKVKQQIAQLSDMSSRQEIMRIYEDMILKFSRYQEEQLANIREQVKKSMEKDEFDYAVEMFVCEETQSRMYKEFYEPLLSTGIVIEEWGNGVLETIFIEADNDVIEERTGTDKRYQALVKTNYDTYPVTVALCKNKEGLQKAAYINRLLRLNGVDMPPVNEGYLHKFYDVIFVESKDRLRPDEIVEEVILSLGELDIFVKRGKTLLWNVRQVPIKENTFPVPMGTEVKYRHELKLNNKQNGYLIDIAGDKLLHKYREANTLWVTTTEKDYSVWNLYEIMHGSEELLSSNGLCVMTNRIRKSMLDTLAKETRRQILTWGELYRKVIAYQVAEFFAEVKVQVADSGLGAEVFFVPKTESHYLNKDVMQFILNDLSALYCGCQITGRIQEHYE